jgi:hypothetical protein
MLIDTLIDLRQYSVKFIVNLMVKFAFINIYC